MTSIETKQSQFNPYHITYALWFITHQDNFLLGGYPLVDTKEYVSESTVSTMAMFAEKDNTSLTVVPGNVRAVV